MSESAATEAWLGPAEPSSPDTEATVAGLPQAKLGHKVGLEEADVPSQNEAAAPGQPETPPDGLEAVDPAIADALKAPKNRQTVLRFEEDVLAFIDSGEEAMFFPLSLSGYQRLLAHRTAQYHGLQTATVDDGGDDHGKIKATRPQPKLEAKPRLSDIKVPEPPQEQKELPKAKKRSSERQSRKDRDSSGTEGGRSAQRSYLDRAQEQRRAQERMIGMAGFHFAGAFGPMLPPTYPPSRAAYPPTAFAGTNFGTPPSEASKAAPKADDQRMDLASSRSRSFSSSNDEDLRRRPSLSQSAPEEQAYPGSAVDVERGMGSMSLHPHGEHAGMVHPGMAMPGYGAIPVPFAYVPTAGGIPQPMPHLQGMGMYGSPPVPFPGYAAAPVPYGYMPGRPQMVPPMLGQPMGHPGMVPFYPGYVPQGYGMPGVTPPVPIQQPPPSSGHSRGGMGLSPGAAAMGRRTSTTAERPHRQEHGSPASSTSRSNKRGMASQASLESFSGGTPSP